MTTLFSNFTALSSIQRRKAYFLLSILLVLIVSCSTEDKKRTFQLLETPQIEGKIGIRGNAYPLSWDSTLFLSSTENNIQLTFPDSIATIEYKYVIEKNGEIVWEQIDNRIANVKAEQFFPSKWNKPKPVDIKTLKKISSKGLLEDFELIKTMVLEVHPGTYRYSDSVKIEKALEELKQKFKKPLSIGEAYLAMSKVTAAIQCDHTKVGFNNQSNVVNAVIHNQPNKVPFTFKWIGNKMIVLLNASEDTRLIQGAEILTINNIPASEIKSSLMPYVAADGATDKSRISKIEVEGFDFRYNAFDVFFPLEFPSQSNYFSLAIKTPDGKTYSSKVKGLTLDDRNKRLKERYSEFPATRDDTWHLNVLDNEIGILTINSYGLFGWKAMTFDYKKFLDSVFTKLNEKRIPNLIIDIRKNNGGVDEMKIELFKYLPFERKFPDSNKRVGKMRYTKFPESLKPYVQTWGDNPWYYNTNPDATKNGYYLFYEDPTRNTPKPPKKNHFKGNVVLLSSAANTSLAYYTARDFKAYKIGTMIGEETGGNLRDINGGQILFLRLPNSGIEIDFPIMGGFNLGNKENSGVLPDKEVHITLESILTNKDIQMNAAIKYLKQTK